ncbi:MAG: type II toxin-antitoxin system VapC family toxin [Acidobacteria bacterium]|nr:type II toxin-antitoxin system VapC family toxin [Acidobacteriota bacterium]
MTERCVDASLIVKLALESERDSHTARRLVRDSIAAGVRLIAPPIFPYEVDSVIRRCVHTGRLDPGDAPGAFAILDRAPVEIVSPVELRLLARQIADQFNQPTVYDALYAALAQLRGCEFWTADRAFFEATASRLGFVRYLPHYSHGPAVLDLPEGVQPCG